MREDQNINTTNSAPGFIERPGHLITIRPSPVRYFVSYQQQIVADSEDCLILQETGYPDVHYFPRDNVKMEFLIADKQTTYCPFKGSAKYWSIKVGQQIINASAWSYENPYDEMNKIENYIAFVVSDAKEMSQDTLRLNTA